MSKNTKSNRRHWPILLLIFVNCMCTVGSCSHQDGWYRRKSVLTRKYWHQNRKGDIAIVLCCARYHVHRLKSTNSALRVPKVPSITYDTNH